MVVVVDVIIKSYFMFQHIVIQHNDMLKSTAIFQFV